MGKTTTKGKAKYSHLKRDLWQVSMAKALESFLWKEHIYCQTCIFQTAEISAVAMCVWGKSGVVQLGLNFMR
jgi:hypothetical protein